MTHRISETLLEKLSKYVAHHMGLHFPKNRWRELVRGIATAAPEFGFEDAENCIKWLLSVQLKQKQIEILASHLTIGETYFFRDQRNLEILEEQILPKLIRLRISHERRLRIWSVACSTGEEPYSLAILLNKLLPAIKSWQISIIATDINPRALKKAVAGVYSEWSFRGTPSWVKEKYFERKSKNSFEIIPGIKRMVRFSYLNLATGIYPSLLNNTNAVDVIFCRNVLMYFTPEQAGKVVRQLKQCLVEGGWLFTSPVDASHIRNSSFKPVSFQEVMVYQKNERQASIMKDPPIQPITKEEKPSPFNFSISTNLPQVEPDVKDTLSPKANKQRSLHEEALALYEQGQYVEAADKASNLISLNPEDAKAHAILARVYANQGKLDEALLCGKKAVEADKFSIDFHYLLSIILQEQGQIEEAVKSLKRTLYLEPDFVQAHFALGNLLRQQGNSKESGKHFQNALVLLSTYDQEEVLPESGGMNAGRLMEIIRFTLNSETSR